MTTPAYADCAADIKKAEARLASNAGQSGRQLILQHLIMAKEKLVKGKKKGCAKQVKKAHIKMDKRGWH